MQKKLFLPILVVILALGYSCAPSPETEPIPDDGIQDVEEQQPEYLGEENIFIPDQLPVEDLIQPEDFTYLGYFRLPEGSGGSDWEYSGHGLTYFSEGDPEGPLDGFPGSLFGIGHDHQLYVSEISIPEPVLTNLEEANVAKTLQPFTDLSGGIFNSEEMSIPRMGIAYLADPEPRIHFNFGQHIQDFEPSHGWATTDLSQIDSEGPWGFDSYTNYVTNDYLFDIPPDWAEAIAPGPLLASGRAREGLWSGRGPALFAYQPGNLDHPPPAGSTLGGVIPLLLYGEQMQGQPDIISSSSQSVNDYRDADHWWGGAWLTTEDSAAVVFAGTKALGEEWYGFANGLVWEHDCAEQTPITCPDPPGWPYDDRGFWAEDYQAQLVFYDPAQLVEVSQGKLDSWQPQPYAVLILDDVLIDPVLNLGEYKRDLLGAAAFDRMNGLFYLFERLADEYRSVIHIWKIKP